MARVISQSVIAPIERPVQLDVSPMPIGFELVEVDALIRASEARARFRADGEGVCVAVLDTGLRASHQDFAGRVPEQRNFTADNGGAAADASDGHGHGTNVAGIIAAGSINIGIAPKARIVPVKVLNNAGGGSFDAIADGLDWVDQNADRLGVSAVCMSLGDNGNYQSDRSFPDDDIQKLIRRLTFRRIAVVVAAGNGYFSHDSRQGMSYPAIFSETISVGAVYDSDRGPFSYASGATAFSTERDRLTPFSQRLHETVDALCRTDIFAPGAPVTSSGITSDVAVSIQHGTSQAAPVIVGVIALLQQLHKRMRSGTLPAVADLVHWLSSSAPKILDGDDENDNVEHTGLTFRRADAVESLSALKKTFEMSALLAQRGKPGSAFL